MKLLAAFGGLRPTERPWTEGGDARSGRNVRHPLLSLPGFLSCQVTGSGVKAVSSALRYASVTLSVS